MVQNILILISFLALGFSAQAQNQQAGKKVYVINEAHESVINQSANPIQTLQQIDRVEMDIANADNFQSLVLVKRCGPGGCTNALNRPVHMDDVAQANSVMASRTSRDLAAGECRVCVAPTAADVGTYVKDLNSTLKNMGALK